MDLSKLRQGASLAESLAAELASLTERGLLTRAERDALRPNMLLAFFRSDIGQRLLHSPEVHREWPFNLRLRRQGDALLQGVIDCAFREDDGWILLDYKTDHIHDEAAFCQRYALQLRLYADALSEITRLPVRQMWLYALRSEKAYEISAE